MDRIKCIVNQWIKLINKKYKTVPKWWSHGDHAIGTFLNFEKLKIWKWDIVLISLNWEEVVSRLNSKDKIRWKVHQNFKWVYNYYLLVDTIYMMVLSSRFIDQIFLSKTKER